MIALNQVFIDHWLDLCVVEGVLNCVIECIKVQFVLRIVNSIKHSSVEIDLAIALILIKRQTTVFFLLLILVVEAFDQALSFFHGEQDVFRVNGFLRVNFVILIIFSLLNVVHTPLFLAELQDLLRMQLFGEKCFGQFKESDLSFSCLDW